LVVEKHLCILQLVDVRWWNAGADYGVSLALGLHRRGHRVIVAGLEESPPLVQAQRLGLAVYATRLGRGGPMSWFSDLNDLVRLIQREKVQLLNAHRAEGHLFSSLASLRLGRRIPVVRTRGDIRPPKGHPLNRWLHLYLTDAVVLPSEALKGPTLGRLRRRPRWLPVIPPGVDADRFCSRHRPSEARSRLGWPAEEPLVGLVGRLSPVKGLNVFLTAAARVIRSLPRTNFAVVGGEAQLSIADLRRMARELHIAHRVHFLGQVAETIPYMEAFDVAVVPSVGSEAICRVALEHMAMSRPVVGTRVNAIPEAVVHERTGLLVPPGDARTLAEAIVILLKDPQKARAMGRAGRRRVESSFTLEHLARRTEHLYARLLAGRRGKPGRHRDHPECQAAPRGKEGRR
jgi:glycosyltransferase involved in cell wall biosynthesis